MHQTETLTIVEEVLSERLSMHGLGEAYLFGQIVLALFQILAFVEKGVERGLVVLLFEKRFQTTSINTQSNSDGQV